MNESELLHKWEQEKPQHEAWGNIIIETISSALKAKDHNLDTLLKIPPKSRLKEDSSLVDKAFYRPGKSYSDPYTEIEDKVGVRFVVLLLNEIKDICDIVESQEIWTFDPCKHFDDDKEKNPLLFTYQSVHYVLRPAKPLEKGDASIDENISCELQIRTLLQHAHAELTHDAVYKSKRAVKPKVHRNVAKSIALIETADDLFDVVTVQLEEGPLKEYGIIERLDGIYESLAGLKSHLQNSSTIIWDTYEQIIDQDLTDRIISMVNGEERSFFGNKIKENYLNNVLYQQSTVLFLYWMLRNRKRRLLQNWPFDRSLIEPLATDLGVSTWDD